MRLPLLFLFCTTLLISGYSQSDGRKNTVYINASHPALFGSKTLIFGYERVIGKNRTFTVNAGNITLPAFAPGNSNDSVKVLRNDADRGFHIGADYRFYLKAENKYDAPRGVYIGPYYAFNNFSKTNTWQLNTSDFDGDVSTQLKMNIHTVGFQMGYQFIFWKRVALDMVLFGPGLGFYNLKGDIKTTLSPEDESLLFEKLNSFLGDKIPGYNLVIEEGEFVKNGSVKTSTLGYRFMINLGFRF